MKYRDHNAYESFQEYYYTLDNVKLLNIKTTNNVYLPNKWKDLLTLMLTLTFEISIPVVISFQPVPN